MIAVIVNPRSRANRRNPAHCRRIPGDRRRSGPRARPQDARRAGCAGGASCRQAPPTVIAVHGGDGTLHKTVTALDRAFGDDPLPPIAILCGGTMNVVATSLGMRERPAVFLQRDRRGDARRAAARDDAAPLPAHRRQARVPVRQRPARQLPGRILRARRIRAGTRGLAAPARLLFGIVAGAVRAQAVQALRGLGRGRRHAARADRVRRPDGGDGPRGRPRLQADPSRRRGPRAVRRAGHALGRPVADPRRLGGAAGRGIAPSRAFSAVASQMDIHSKNGSDGLHDRRRPLPDAGTGRDHPRAARRVREATLCVDCAPARRYHGGQR